jgi:hypothetical protein
LTENLTSRLKIHGSIEILRLFGFASFAQGCDLGAQAFFAEASRPVGRHGNDMRQLRAPAAAFRLAGHRGAALCASFFHLKMMKQLCGGVQMPIQRDGG